VPLPLLVRQLRSLTLPCFAEDESLLATIRALPSNIESADFLANPSTMVSLVLPVPFDDPGTSVRFRVTGAVKRSFAFFGRESYKPFSDLVMNTINSSVRERSISLFGTVGCGKSHMIAAAACVLFYMHLHGRLNRRVIYIHNGTNLLRNFYTTVNGALRLSFHDDATALQSLDACDTISDLAAFTKHFCRTCILIVDQKNAIEPGVQVKDHKDVAAANFCTVFQNVNIHIYGQVRS